MKRENENLKEENVFTSRRKKLAYEIEYARLSFRTEELEHFYETKKWIQKGLDHFRNSHTGRPQIMEELRGEAVAHVKERWREYKRAGKPITGGLVLRMTLTCLKKHIAKNETILSHPHPERMKKREEYERLAKIAEEKLSWREKQIQENLRIDIKDIKRDSLTLEGRIVMDGKREGETNAEIKYKLEALGHRSVQHLLYEKIEAIRELLKKKGYPRTSHPR